MRRFRSPLPWRVWLALALLVGVSALLASQAPPRFPGPDVQPLPGRDAPAPI